MKKSERKKILSRVNQNNTSTALRSKILVFWKLSMELGGGGGAGGGGGERERYIRATLIYPCRHI